MFNLNFLGCCTGTDRKVNDNKNEEAKNILAPE